MAIQRKKEEGELPAEMLKQANKTKLTTSSDGDAKTGGEKKTGEQKSSDKEAKSDAQPAAKVKKKDEQVESPLVSAIKFLEEVRAEFYKVSWPDLPQVVRESFSVLVLVAAITLMVLGFDWILAHGVFQPLEHFARLHGSGVNLGAGS